MLNIEDVCRYFAMFFSLFIVHNCCTTVVHATDSQTTFVAHSLHLCGTSYGLTPCKIACLASVVKHTRWRVPVNTSRKLSLAYLSLLW